MPYRSICFGERPRKILALTSKRTPDVRLVHGEQALTHQRKHTLPEQSFRFSAEPNEVGVVSKAAKQVTIPVRDHAGHGVREGLDEVFGQVVRHVRPSENLSDLTPDDYLGICNDKTPITVSDL